MRFTFYLFAVLCYFYHFFGKLFKKSFITIILKVYKAGAKQNQKVAKKVDKTFEGFVLRLKMLGPLGPASSTQPFLTLGIW